MNALPQAPRDRRIDSLNRTISVLLQGISLHSFCHDEDEFEVFQGSLRKLREQIARTDDDDTRVLLAGSAIRILEEHNRTAGCSVAARRGELEATVALVAESLLKVSHTGESQALELRESERDVAVARHPSDMAAARARITRCLEDIGLRVLRRNETALSPSQAWSESEIDTVTGLPDSRKAVDAIVAAWNRRDEYTAAVFAVRRLDTINARFGFEAGDEILRVMSDHLAGFFAETRLLFRWRGPYLLGLIEKRTEPRVIADLQRATSVKLQHSITSKDREIILPISMIWTVVPLDAQSIELMIRRLDELTTSRMRQENAQPR